jgi:SulP family sulfate permease
VRIPLDHRSTLAALFPFLGWRSRVNRKSLRSDAIAGLSGAILVLPQAIAYATIAGLPPQYGVYAAMVPAIVGALFGSSWHLVSGPTATMSIVVFATLSPLAVPGTEEYVQLLTFTFLAGILMLIMARPHGRARQLCFGHRHRLHVRRGSADRDEPAQELLRRT